MLKFIFTVIILNIVLFAFQSYSDKMNKNVFFYYDQTSKLTQNTIKSKDNFFKTIDISEPIYKAKKDGNLWLKFSLKNETYKTKNYVVEYKGNSLYRASLYDFNHKTIDINGIDNLGKYRKNKGFAFKINLAPHSSVEYYLKIENDLSDSYFKLLLWDSDEYFKVKHEHFNVVFFINLTMGILILYNLLIFLFTRDIAYIYYILVTFSSLVFLVLYNQFMQSGYIFVYPNLVDLFSVKFTQWVALASFIFLPLFAREFLQLKTSLPQVDSYFKYAPFGFIVLTLLSIYTSVPSSITLAYLVVMLLAIVIVSGVVFFKGVKQAKYHLFGSLVVLVSLLVIVLYHYAFIDVDTEGLYLIHIALLTQALIFSIGLSARVYYEKEKKELADAKLLSYQKDETLRLEKEVSQRTKELKEALDLKEMLFKEVHHRVKNNMQMIISLLRLQADSLHEDKFQDALEVSEQRIKAMSGVHEMLYMRDNINEVDTKEYFTALLEELQDAYDANKQVKINIKSDVILDLDKAIYVGLVVNEIVTNSFKYAFEEGSGVIDLNFSLEKDTYTLIIADNGKDGKVKEKNDSLGIKLIKTLVKSDLKGTVEILEDKGVKFIIKFKRVLDEK